MTDDTRDRQCRRAEPLLSSVCSLCKVSFTAGQPGFVVGWPGPARGYACFACADAIKKDIRANLDTVRKERDEALAAAKEAKASLAAARDEAQRMKSEIEAAAFHSARSDAHLVALLAVARSVEFCMLPATDARGGAMTDKINDAHVLETAGTMPCNMSPAELATSVWALLDPPSPRSMTATPFVTRDGVVHGWSGYRRTMGRDAVRELLADGLAVEVKAPLCSHGFERLAWMGAEWAADAALLGVLPDITDVALDTPTVVGERGQAWAMPNPHAWIERWRCRMLDIIESNTAPAADVTDDVRRDLFTLLLRTPGPRCHRVRSAAVRLLGQRGERMCKWWDR